MLYELPHAFDLLKPDDIDVIPDDSPIVARLDPDLDGSDNPVRILGQLAFRMGKDQHADVSRKVVQDLAGARWTQLEFVYACDAIATSSDPDLLKEIRFARVIGNVLFNTVRRSPYVLAGRLHSEFEAGAICRQWNRPIGDIFRPVFKADRSAGVFYMLSTKV